MVSHFDGQNYGGYQTDEPVETPEAKNSRWTRGAVNWHTVTWRMTLVSSRQPKWRTYLQKGLSRFFFCFPITIKEIFRVWIAAFSRQFSSFSPQAFSPVWFWFVDDTFTLFDRKNSETQFLHDLNTSNCHATVKFTVEFEENSTIPFLGTSSNATLTFHNIYFKVAP